MTGSGPTLSFFASKRVIFRLGCRDRSPRLPSPISASVAIVATIAPHAARIACDAASVR